jgi:hypothetical protein
MEQLYTLGIAVVTSGVGLLVGIRALGLPAGKLRAAIHGMLECLGLTAMFFGVNLGLGMAVILAFRTLTTGFAPLYLANDVSLLVFSLLQALVFSRWWKAGS